MSEDGPQGWYDEETGQWDKERPDPPVDPQDRAPEGEKGHIVDVDLGARVFSEPVDRLTGLCAEMTEPLDREENGDVKAIVFLQDGERSGIVMHGYEDQVEGMADLFVHMKAIFQGMGRDLTFVGIPENAEGLDG